MIDCQQVINSRMDKIQDHSHFMAISDIQYWVKYHEVEPFKRIKHRNKDVSAAVFTTI